MGRRRAPRGIERQRTASALCHHRRRGRLRARIRLLYLGEGPRRLGRARTGRASERLHRGMPRFGSRAHGHVHHMGRGHRRADDHAASRGSGVSAAASSARSSVAASAKPSKSTRTPSSPISCSHSASPSRSCASSTCRKADRPSIGAMRPESITCRSGHLPTCCCKKRRPAPLRLGRRRPLKPQRRGLHVRHRAGDCARTRPSSRPSTQD